MCAGNHTFLVSASNWAVLRMWSLPQSSAATLVTTTASCASFFCSPQQESAAQQLQAGRQYLLEARHIQWDAHGHLGVAIISPSSTLRSGSNTGCNTASNYHELQDSVGGDA